MTLEGQIAGVDPGPDDDHLKLRFRQKNGQDVSLLIEVSELDQTTAILQTAFVAKKFRDKGRYVHRNENWANSPVGRFGLPEIGILPNRNEIVLAFALGTVMQTAFAVPDEKIDELLTDIQESRDELRNPVVRL